MATSHRTISPADADAPTRIGLVVSRYNDWITGPLRDGAVEAFQRLATGNAELVEAAVPGTFEVPGAASAMAHTGNFDAVVCLGCVIKGETEHDRFINDAVSSALTEITIRTGVPVAFGILTVSTPEQAEARAGGAMGNKGAEAMEAAFDVAATVRCIGRECGEKH